MKLLGKRFFFRHYLTEKYIIENLIIPNTIVIPHKVKSVVKNKLKYFLSNLRGKPKNPEAIMKKVETSKRGSLDFDNNVDNEIEDLEETLCRKYYQVDCFHFK